MTITSAQIKANQDQRKHILLEAAKVFLNRGSQVMVLKPTSVDPVNGMATSDPEQVENALIINPLCNVAAIVGRNHNLIAIKFERESDYDPDPFESLAQYESDLGKLPATMTIEYPNKVQYRLYEYPLEGETHRTRIDSGIQVIKSDAMGNSGLILLDRSDLPAGPVRELSHSDNISILPDSWIKYICSDPYEDLAEIDLPVKDEQAQPIVEEEQKYLPSPVIIDEQTFNDDQQVCDFEESGLNGSDKLHSVSHEDLLLLKIAQMSNSGEPPSNIVSTVLHICTHMSIDYTYDRVFMLVYNVVRGMNCYEGLVEDEKFLRFIADVELTVFKDHHKEICCKINTTGEVIPLTTKNESKISKYLNYRVQKLTNVLPKDSTVKSVMKGLDVIAHFESDAVEMFNRIGRYEREIYYDLGNENAVCITSGGWNLRPCPPVFRRYANHKEQVTPLAGGKLERFFEFVNHEETDKLLLMVYMVSALIPGIAHPLLYVYGAHGSAKSSLSSKIKAVIDPSATEKLSLGKKAEEVVRNLKQYYVSLYDNISYLPGDISDLFCMASTGGAVDIRKFYTNEDSVIMSFKHCVILNGIKIAIKKPDLLDRTILIKLKRVDAKEESVINAAFEEALPEIFGGLLDTLSKALELYPTITLDKLPRMADFAKWGYAIAEAIGGHGEQFIKDYAANIADQNDLIASGNKLCQAVLELMENKVSYPTTIGKAFEELKRLARTDAQDRSFPRRSNELRPYLEELGPVLDSFGIQFEFGKIKGAHGWSVTFTNSTIATEQPVE